MKSSLIVATIALALGAHAAYAGEGAGDPFPFRAPGVTTSMQNFKQAPGGLDDPYPMKIPGQVLTPTQAEALAPSNGAEGTVQSLNGLPRGFTNGMPSYAQVRSASPTAIAQTTTAGGRHS
jgi:hypothetical protein